MKKAPVIGALAAGSVALGCAFGSGGAVAAPIGVQQIPATATVFSGLVVPGVWFANVAVATTATPGVVAISTPAAPNVCGTTAIGVQVRVDYWNLNTGVRGSVTVKPCDLRTPVPLVANAATGRGQIAFTTNVTGSAYKPTAGQPALPGGGTFAVS